jgi:signal transduction histidine kinase
VVSEVLTNVAKHAHHGHAEAMARIDDDALRLQVSDDGVGSARSEGSGLLGLGDRLAALDGTRARISANLREPRDLTTPDGGSQSNSDG